ncbi:Ribonuclease/ribotoxin [Xylaria cf. heliscus]|nr:Ribonuclease/ribotoxin [Xylaria cf. heliscus]
MLFKNIVAASMLSTFVAADYSCLTNLGRFTIKSAWATAARDAGGAVPGASGFPHKFGGGANPTTQLVFYGADARCNQRNPALWEYPVLKDGKKYPKDQSHGTTPTPARVVYLQADPKVLCGVMTHVIEDKNDHHGSGDFRVCDPIN